MKAKRLNMGHIKLFFLTGILVILMLFFAAARFILTTHTTIDSAKESPKALYISTQEKTQIDTWIKTNHLNQYGDNPTTAYLGGSPLFDESTGKTLDRYAYIVRRHPNHPWKP